MTAYMDHKDLTNETIEPRRAAEIRDGARRVLDRIATAELEAGRPEGSVTLLAATKTRDVGEIMAAIDAGVRMVGANRPQELVAKIDGLRYCCSQRGLTVGVHDFDVEDGNDPSAMATVDSTHIPVHLIGQLQANKIGKILPYANVVESVDSLDLATKIARRAVVRGNAVGVMLEVNESGEESKSGCRPEEACDLAGAIGELDGVELTGLMTIGAHVDDETEIRRCFADLRGLRDRIAASGMTGTAGCRELSMGMSGDMELAIREGATIVRVGTAIFGPRAFI
ncbi:YggS family pyridoxal phosphate-dependent enzyme [Bifidobacterium choloepi]|uniref:Pyridoxal phosphate homeostasis protein n=1 Tax=Bifidobacterium choloepi TaxID=2614131 RepID=A0A6I5NNK0_9BIFI|nr:YggS family pyridoxal phosphate-dependent enzyme [Bifidobacterium choloepi]NEG70292.1 YggS family pyridoxal phosphate-dependent enzyme [Bifidobacterium choloepi]